MAHKIAGKAMSYYHVDIKHDNKKDIWHYKPKLRFQLAVKYQQNFNNRKQENTNSIPNTWHWNLPAQDAPYKMHNKHHVHNLHYIYILTIDI